MKIEKYINKFFNSQYKFLLIWGKRGESSQKEDE